MNNKVETKGNIANAELPPSWQALKEEKEKPQPKEKKNKGWWKGKSEEKVNEQLDKGFDYAARRTEATAFRYRKMIKGEKYEVYGADEDECRGKMEQAIRDKKEGRKNHENPSLAEWMRIYMVNYLAGELNIKNAEKKKAESTFSNYESTIRNHIIETKIGKLHLKELMEIDLIRHFQNLQAEKPSMAKNSLWLLKKALQRAVKNGIIHQNPADEIKLATKIVKKPKTPTEDIITIIQHILKYSQFHELGLVYEIGFRLGMRRGEILGLPINRINLTERKIDIYQQLVKTNHLVKNLNGTKVIKDIDKYKPSTIKSVKTDNSRREIPIPEALFDKISNRVQEAKNRKNRVKDCCLLDNTEDFTAETDLLFRKEDGGVCFADTPTKTLKKFVGKITRDMGLEISADTEELLTSHDMRKLANSLLANKDVSQAKLEALLGHSPKSDNVNTKHYTAISPEALRPVVELLSDIIDGKEPLFDNPGNRDTQNNTQN